MKCITYNGGYKYQLKETYTIAIDIKPRTSIDTEYIDLDTQGNITIREGYAWDGPSGPTIDTLTFMRGSLVHDALDQLMRANQFNHGAYLESPDRVLHRKP